MKKFMPIVASTVALTAFTTAANAEDMSTNDSGLYLGGNYGYLKVDNEDDFDDSNDMWQGVLGYRFNSFFALEGAYSDFGEYGNSISNAETTGYSAALKGTLPITDTVEIFAKAGQLWYETDYNVAGFNGSNDDEALFAGAGLNFNLSQNLLLSAQYTWYDVDLNADEAADSGSDTDFDTDFNQASLGLEYRF